MTKTRGTQKAKTVIDRWLLAISGLLLVLTAGAVIYAIGFLSNHLFKAFTLPPDGGQAIEFHLEDYKALDLE